MFRNRNNLVVTAEEMQNIERTMFADKMPVASLMEKAALLTSLRIMALFPAPSTQCLTVMILVGSGHNGGDGLVIARELHLKGYNVIIYAPFAQKSKNLTAQHLLYARNLGIKFTKNISKLSKIDVIIDALFGIGLSREITGDLADTIEKVNSWSKPIISVDIPSGIDSDTGKVWGVAIKAQYTFCLGMYKRGLWQDQALSYVGKLELIDIGVSDNHIAKINPAPIALFTEDNARENLPLPRAVNTYKYQQGHLLLICGSKQYAGATLLSAYGARASGVGMVTVIVPESLRSMVLCQLPEMLVMGAEETATGAMVRLPELDLNKYQWVACGMGLTRDSFTVVEEVINSKANLLIDADALNIIADGYFHNVIANRQGQTVLTPHDGEFKRLFPQIATLEDRIMQTQEGALFLNCLILRKGAKSIISDGNQTYLIPLSCPALARGGSGDVLSGVGAGLLAQSSSNALAVVSLSAWLHQRGALLASQDLSILGVDGVTLSQYILKAISLLNFSPK